MISNDSVYINEETGINKAYTLNHFEHLYRENWFDETEGKNVILDLDLDFFNFTYDAWNSNPALLPEALIRHQLKYIKNSMWDWDMVTVALSPEHCGGEDVFLQSFFDVFDLDIHNAISW